MPLDTRLSAVITAIGSDIKALIAKTGVLGNLTTTTKTDLVSAINELKGAQVVINDVTASGTTTYSSNKINSAITAGIAGVVGAAPAALDTLKEIADQLATDESATAGLVTAVGLRVRVDAAQAFTAAQTLQARANIGAQDAALIGNADADLVALYTAAKL